MVKSVTSSEARTRARIKRRREGMGGYFGNVFGSFCLMAGEIYIR
jgi:hypothetical protein